MLSAWQEHEAVCGFCVKLLIKRKQFSGYSTDYFVPRSDDTITKQVANNGNRFILIRFSNRCLQQTASTPCFEIFFKPVQG